MGGEISIARFLGLPLGPVGAGDVCDGDEIGFVGRADEGAFREAAPGHEDDAGVGDADRGAEKTGNLRDCLAAYDTVVVGLGEIEGGRGIRVGLVVCRASGMDGVVESDGKLPRRSGLTWCWSP